MALGRGLSELLGEVEAAYESNSEHNDFVKELDISLIEANPYQPRKMFDAEKLQELSDSIKSHGLLQPIVVIQKENKYLLIAGERRLRASKLANFETIKAIIADIDEVKLREYALLENIQRDDLNVLEVAYSYAGLINDYEMTHESLANLIHKSRSSITNTLRLLTLSVYTQQMISADKLTAGHAKILVGLNEDEQKKVVDTIIGQRLSVRESENLVRSFKEEPKKTSKINTTKDIKLDFSPLDNIISQFNDEDIKMKISGSTIRIKINSQDDIETLQKYFYKK